MKTRMLRLRVWSELFGGPRPAVLSGVLVLLGLLVTSPASGREKCRAGGQTPRHLRSLRIFDDS